MRAAWGFSRIICRNQLSHSQVSLPFISVIVAARNEADHIFSCLTSLLTQEYPQERYEVILVNDHSTDLTLDIALQLTQEYPNLKILNLKDYSIPAGTAFKKAALNVGVANAQGEWIFQTDGDCVAPFSWIRTMANHIEKDIHFLSGPVFLTYDSTFLQRIQSLEFMGLIALGAGNMAVGTPNMCNGANMGYRKQSFNTLGGYSGIRQVASGDDELLLQKFIKYAPNSIRFIKCSGAIIRTPAISNWRSLMSQRLRWVSKARSYTVRSINLVQLIYYFAFLTFPILGIFSIISLDNFLYLGTFLAVKCLVDATLLTSSAKFFRNLNLLWYLLPLEILYIGYVLWIGVAGNRLRTYQWKGRTVS